MTRWVEHDAPWHEQRMVHCSACGRLIAKHLLLAEAGGEERIFCGDDCAQLYRDYLLPERGPAYRPPADIGAQYEERMVR